MKQYIERLKTEKTPHERRQYALRVSGVITALLFLGWVSSLGITFSRSSGDTAATNNAAATLTAVDASTTLGY